MPLAANVTDQEPHLPVGVVAVVEVSADDGVLGRRDGAYGDADVADPLGQHGEDGALGNLRDLGDRFVTLLAPDPHGGDDDGDEADPA